jgi:hypothetical protein
MNPGVSDSACDSKSSLAFVMAIVIFVLTTRAGHSVTQSFRAELLLQL